MVQSVAKQGRNIGRGRSLVLPLESICNERLDIWHLLFELQGNNKQPQYIEVLSTFQISTSQEAAYILS